MGGREGFGKERVEKKCVEEETVEEEWVEDRREYIIPCCIVPAAAPSMAASLPTWSCPFPPESPDSPPYPLNHLIIHPTP